ncbi:MULTISPECIES: DUF3450 family protein [Shewanella]|uniref:DUF3450 family protein n=1 Tax=Shewanella fidelis TaxID=173509 RepID=A0AAW8NGU4_9GAMM|nr:MULTISPECIES: DUF3450 family protein [Shewanella]MDR8522572.1 DUF3450 family protein [Shewanella fidelis]MDW4812188.1 DUF3450 family protein [Shewanella fidelis]MDW4816148.1 DUF3450 family protein [Shewanella fidelis]MDW4820429.1 DUF3450 family protein [Shewanella fidelis]MDW4824651.1 DUF3450 family protein [Shewanella fidelis]
MQCNLLIYMLLLLVFLTAPVRAESSSLQRSEQLQRTDQLMAQKLALDKASAELSFNWQKEQVSLLQLKANYQAERQLLQLKLHSAGAQSDDAVLRRQSLAKEQAKAEQTTVEYQTLLTQGVASFTQSWPLLPEPLKRSQLQEYRQLTNEKAELAQRLTALVHLLEATNSFDQTFTLDKQILKLNGQDWQAEVLYLGLAKALFRLPDGSHVGMGIPAGKTTTDTWHWQVNDDAQEEINQTFAIYLQQQKASLVTLPLFAQGGLHEKE